ncbi:hypothetical protein LOOC260_102870 [Paucilactobacillus hokkaidonensis JCM 18461]|uniref:AbrB family transcriptional regulator n=2 Tax=Paucilactobacillus hokkaidonensis TaxID=1193095 RepID=A0A0A1GS80_9LACO|nr:hypothetical protein [Paucilactobacillus hokkaidonensis]KRO09359.1 hypothetical protein IV59_GL000697 [Paucilactobacillus hokkaidonensis]BAP84865.1 hypothetical protein LOOC260_102870 [Paucilactobacillus hokkaidonensis JCM 18461]
MSKSLGIFSTRKAGNSLILTVPTTSGVTEGVEFELIKEEDGSLVYKPKNSNPWLDGTYDGYDFRKDLNKIGNFGDEGSVGKEV